MMVGKCGIQTLKVVVVMLLLLLLSFGVFVLTSASLIIFGLVVCLNVPKYQLLAFTQTNFMSFERTVWVFTFTP